jgi:uncharacterized protein YbjT (DUF2867 family)
VDTSSPKACQSSIHPHMALKSSCMTKTILDTGANGFVGRALCQHLLADGHSVIATVRSAQSAATLPSGLRSVLIKPLAPATDWSDALPSADVVVHLASTSSRATPRHTRCPTSAP